MLMQQFAALGSWLSPAQAVLQGQPEGSARDPHRSLQAILLANASLSRPSVARTLATMPLASRPAPA